MKIVVSICAFLLGGYYSMSILGGALVGYGEIATIRVFLEMFIPCFIGSLVFGFLNARHWRVSAFVGSIPSFILFTLMFQGIIVEGNISEAYWFCVPIGIIIGFFFFGFIGSKMARVRDDK